MSKKYDTPNSEKSLTWTFESDDPATVQAWKDSAPQPVKEKEMPKQSTDNITGPPGSAGFTTRIGRLNKLYHNLTPEQRANHPGFNRLLEVIKLEQSLNDQMLEGSMGYTQPPEEAVPVAEPVPPTTGKDKRQQETAAGIRRPLNNVLDAIDKSGQ